MTLAELIAKAEALYPSEFDKYELTQWVNEVEFMAVDQVINRAKGPIVIYEPYKYDLDAEKELLIPDQFNGAYTTYLATKIDFNNKEIDRYNLDAMQFEAEWQAYASWYRRNFRPRRMRYDAVSYCPDKCFEDIFYN